jgi:ABC-type dipeptide/oligopeptide/nickel transport system permease component
MHRPVTDLIAERALPSFELAFTAILISCLISIPLGALSAIRNRTWLDYLCMGTSLIGISMPNFWLGPLLILLFSVHLGWLPVSGRSSPSSIILPALALSSSLSAVLIRMTRTSVLEQLHEDYIRTARSKGSGELRVFFKHVLKNSAISITTILGLQFGALATGTIITEKVFDWPGIGTLIAEAIERRDYPVVQGCVFVFSLTFLINNLVTDLIYFWLDPRIRVGKR